MTEAEWQSSEDARYMLRCLFNQYNAHRRKVGKRKLWLFAAACCRTRWEAMTDPRSRAAVEYVEQLADDLADTNAMESVREGARQAATDIFEKRLGSSASAEQRAEYEDRQLAADSAHILLLRGIGKGQPSGAVYADEALRGGGAIDRIRLLADLLRDIFGSPFSPPHCEPSWKTATVTGLALGIYEDRAFDRLPILADALQDAGCEDEQALGHCHAPGPHARGCWLVDLLLGKGQARGR